MRRRIAIVFGIVTAVVASAAAQAPPPVPQLPPASPQAATPPTGRAPALAFASDAGIILSPINPKQTAVFEHVMKRVHDALEKSADPVRKQQAAGWKVFKGTEPFQGAVLYISVMDPAVKGADYNVFELLLDVMGDTEARGLFEEFRAAFSGSQHVVNMSPLISMAPVEKK